MIGSFHEVVPRGHVLISDRRGVLWLVPRCGDSGGVRSGSRLLEMVPSRDASDKLYAPQIQSGACFPEKVEREIRGIERERGDVAK